MPLIASPRKSAAPKHGLDAKAEYLDADGVMRRSESVTRRMLQRGLSISHAAVFTDADQAHMSLDERERDEALRNAKFMSEIADLQQKQGASSAFKTRIKAERRRWIDESYALVALRLDILYSNELVAHGDPAIDVTEQNTPLSPSKHLRYIDESGNLRRKSTALSSVTGPTDAALEVEPTAKDHGEYVQVATPPVTSTEPPYTP